MSVRWSEIRSRAWNRWRGPTAFVLSGGGPAGAAQVGMLQGLLEAGITPDAMIGTSVGALNAVFIANDPTLRGAEKLREVWMSMRREDLFPGGKISSALNILRRGSCVFSNSGLRGIIESGLEATTFEQLKIPAHINATQLSNGEERWFSSGSIADALLASAAMPGVFPPVQIDGHAYIDGGVTNNVPVLRGAEIGAKSVVVISVNAASQRRELTRPHDFMMHGFVLARGHRYERDLAAARQKASVRVIPTLELGYVPFTDMSQTERLIEAGLAATRKWLAEESRSKGHRK